VHTVRASIASEAMRQVSFVRRVASLLLGCWLAIFVVEPAALHSCPIHDGVAPASHMMHHHAPATPGHGCCTCPGACCPAAGARLERAPVVVPARIVAIAMPDVAAPPLVRLGCVQRILPPAIGPPSHSV
jgi:hypothetical protein